MAKSHILDKLLSDNGLFLLKSWIQDGYTVDDVCDMLGITSSTFYKWKNEYPQIDEAMAAGKELIDYKVENALLKTALGYKTKEVKVTTIMRHGKVVETQEEVLTKEQPPNVQAITMWLCNRNKKKWSTPNSRNLLDEVEEDSTIQVTVTRAGKRSDDEGDEVNEEIEISRAEDEDVTAVDEDEAWAQAEAEVESEEWQETA